MNSAPTQPSGGLRSEVLAFSVLLLLLAALACIHIYWQRLNFPPIRSDGLGYHAYLPTTVIDGNLSFDLTRRQVGDVDSLKNDYGIGVNPVTGRMSDKYTPGAAMLQLPFFAAGDLAARAIGAARSGYSAPYQAASILAGIFYLCLGAGVLLNLMLRFHGAVVAVPSLVAVVFATNVFHYGTYDGSFAHVYGWAVMAVYLWLLDVWRRAPRRNGWRLPAAAGLTLGVLAMVRVPDAIVAVLAGGLIIQRWHASGDARAAGRAAAVFGAFALAGVAPLLLWWKYSTGSWVVNSYKFFPKPGGVIEQFHWSSPEIVNFLFSVQKGLFFWTPAVLLAVIALPLLIRWDRALGLAVAAVLALHVYVCASWWAWTYGGSFGSRPFVDMMPLVALPLAAGLQWAGDKWGRAGPNCMVGLFVVLNLFLMYSYWRGYIPFDGTTWDVLRELPCRYRLCS